MVRFKNRALLVKVHFLDKAHGGIHLSASILHEALRKACNQILGVKSMALISNMRVKYVDLLPVFSKIGIWNLNSFKKSILKFMISLGMLIVGLV